MTDEVKYDDIAAKRRCPLAVMRVDRRQNILAIYVAMAKRCYHQRRHNTMVGGKRVVRPAARAKHRCFRAIDNRPALHRYRWPSG